MRCFTALCLLVSAAAVSNVLINVGGENTWTSGNCYVGHGSGVKTASSGVMTDGVTESRKGYWHSCRGRGAWAKFRLPYISDIDSVSVWNRADCCEGRIHGATASLVDVEGKEHKCSGTFTNNGKGKKTTVKCPNVAANYIIVRSNGRHHLHFSEVAAAGNRHSTKNLLLNVGSKNTWTSGNCYVGHSSGVKNGATTDVLTDGKIASKKGYWHSCRGSGSWAKFRLSGASSVTSVELFNRGDCCEGRINGATASLVDVDGKEHKCSGTFKNHGRGTPTSVNCDKSVNAAYVIVRGGRHHLHFSEARAFGTVNPVCPITCVPKGANNMLIKHANHGGKAGLDHEKNLQHACWRDTSTTCKCECTRKGEEKKEEKKEKKSSVKWILDHRTPRGAQSCDTVCADNKKTCDQSSLDNLNDNDAGFAAAFESWKPGHCKKWHTGCARGNNCAKWGSPFIHSSHLKDNLCWKGSPVAACGQRPVDGHHRRLCPCQ